MPRKLLIELGPEHIGRSMIPRTCTHCGKSDPIMLGNVLGRVLPSDVGKRVYNVDGVVQVENDQQRDKRLKSPVPRADTGGHGTTPPHTDALDNPVLGR